MNNNMSNNTLPDNKLSDIDLEYLINKELYGKSIDSKMQPHINTNNKKDKRFYKKRIYDLTKQLLSNEQPSTLFPDVRNTFDNYIKTCISYFKVIDTSDIIQEDYDDLLGPINNATSVNNVAGVDNIDNIDEVNKLMMRSIKIMEPNALEKLVKRTIIKKEKEPIIPQQKDINLKDPILKNKGIHKKKNITNKYDENVILEKDNHSKK
jgi:hypothetical protein